MGVYIGSKLVRALYMTRGEYNQYRGWETPADEDPNDIGVLVEYQDGGKPNDYRHEGYISWSPKDVFEKSYRAVEGMSFGLAIEAMKMGKRVARSGWNGSGLWVEYVPAHGVDLAYLQMSYPVGSRQYPNGARVPWLASQTDMLTDDWRIVE